MKPNKISLNHIKHLNINNSINIFKHSILYNLMSVYSKKSFFFEKSVDNKCKKLYKFSNKYFFTSEVKKITFYKKMRE